MSDIQSLVPGTDNFLGEAPLPEPVDVADPGFSRYPAPADHVHDFLIGNPWFNLPLLGTWVVLAGGFRLPSYTRIGNLVVVRGSVSGPAGSSNLAQLPVNYRPISGIEWYTVPVAGSGNAQVLIGTNGIINVSSHPGGTLGLPYLMFTMD